jgi:hypothetical protein
MATPDEPALNDDRRRVHQQLRERDRDDDGTRISVDDLAADLRDDAAHLMAGLRMDRIARWIVGLSPARARR